MAKAPQHDVPVEIAYLDMFPVAIGRWEDSKAYRRMSLAAQGAYINLWFSAWKAQPSCVLPDDDRELWRLANCRTIREWQDLKAEVFSDTDAWAYEISTGWLHEVVLEVYLESARKYARAVQSGRIAGKASGRARRAAAQAKRIKEDRTTVERTLNDRRTESNPWSLSESLSLSLSKTTEQRTTPPPPQGGGFNTPPVENPEARRQRIRAELRATWERREHQVEQAIAFAKDSRIPVGRYGPRRFRRWFKQGATLGSVQAAIEQREHLAERDGCRPWIEISKHLSPAELDLLDLDEPEEEAHAPPARNTQHAHRRTKP